MKRLLAKQVAFVDGVIAGKTQEQAAIDAGYSQRNAKSIAGQMMMQPHIRGEVDRRRALVSNRVDLSREWWLGKLKTEAEEAAESATRVSALREIGKAQKYYPAERHEVAGADGGPLVIEVINYASPASE
jgi:phage terminase small subunit